MPFKGYGCGVSNNRLKNEATAAPLNLAERGAPRALMLLLDNYLGFMVQVFWFYGWLPVSP